MLLSKTVKIIPSGKNISYYRNLGYDAKWHEELEVSVDDLLPYCCTKVDCSCDYCGAIVHPTYADYLKTLKQTIPKIACVSCKGKKTKESNMIVYGVESVNQLPEQKAKIMQTNLERYGKSSYLATNECKEALKNYCLNNYGTTNPGSSKELHEKMKKTMQQKYNVDAPLKIPGVKERVQTKWKEKTEEELYNIRKKTQETCMQRYNSTNPMKNEEIKKRQQESFAQKYGVTSPMKNEDIVAKLRNTLYKNNTTPTSAQQKYIHKIFGGAMNFPISRYNLDICLIDEKLDIEYDGRGHDLMVSRGNMSEEEFKKKEMIRDKQIKAEGYKVIRIISRKDKLPSDTILLEMLSYARNFFTTNPERSWISFDIDNSCIYNAYHKEQDGGLPYDFGTLRKIKKSDLQEETEQAS